VLYFDVTSLYPYVNKTKKYPMGHPTIIYDNVGDVKQYFGLVKLKIPPPPRGLYFPVLPSRIHSKLMFTLCRSCAEMHDDEERASVDTWCTVEIEVALERGYTVAEIFEIWHFEHFSHTLFSDNINMHLKGKQEASGFSDWYTDEAKCQKYIDEYYKREGIRLSRQNIRVNPAKRQISKLFLNSLWGKFGQRPNVPVTSLIGDPNELFEKVFIPYYDVSSVEFIDEDTAYVCWKYAKGHYGLNIFIVTFTTAYARLELYRLLDQLQERCLYHDTDSVIFGDYLGEMTSEVPSNERVVEFVSSGPKSYAYRLSSGKACIKLKGVTLNVKNSEKVNFDSLKDLVMDFNSK
uniref:DNA-directed DNA polymerase n=1 Tax=Latimeria chalumnae TaxID=7897 RepID=H3ANZ5_LATCH